MYYVHNQWYDFLRATLYSLHTQVFEYNSISGRINNVRLIFDCVPFLFLAHAVIFVT